MKTLIRAGRDLIRELGFVLLYGLLAAIVMSSLIGSASGIKRMLKTAGFVSSFRNGGVDMVILEGMGSYKNVRPTDREADHPLDAFLREGLKRGGKLGGAAVKRLGGADGFDNLIVVVGSMVDITLSGVPEDRAVYAAVSPDLSERIGTNAVINGNEFPIESAVPGDMTCGTLYSRTQSADTERALFLFVRDYDSAASTICAPQELLMKLIAVGADEEYKAELISMISGATGMHARIWSAEDHRGFGHEILKAEARLFRRRLIRARRGDDNGSYARHRRASERLSREPPFRGDEGADLHAYALARGGLQPASRGLYRYKGDAARGLGEQGG